MIEELTTNQLKELNLLVEQELSLLRLLLDSVDKNNPFHNYRATLEKYLRLISIKRKLKEFLDNRTNQENVHT